MRETRQFDARALQDEFDTEGAHLAVSRLIGLAPEPELHPLVGGALLLVLFITATILIVAFTGAQG